MGEYGSYNSQAGAEESTNWHLEVHLLDTCICCCRSHNLLRGIPAGFQINLETLCIQPTQDTSATPRFARKLQLLQQLHSRLQA